MTPKLSLKGIAKYTVTDLNLDVHEGELLTLLGASGSGKTTTLRIIAGLARPDDGIVVIDGETVVDDSTFIPAENRAIGMVFQNFSLFPHMTVNQNVAFGLYKMKKRKQKAIVKEMLVRVKLDEYGKRYPHQLSGGQQQRVALARAMATSPSLLLFDEPFSSLDENLRDSLRAELRAMLKEHNVTAIFVTHDKKDALSLSDRVAVLNDGVIEQNNTPKEIYMRPASTFIAQYFGQTNIVKATACEDGFESELGHIDHDHAEDQGREGHLSIRPQWCAIDHEDCHFSGTVSNITYFGDFEEITLVLPTQKSFVIHHHRGDRVNVGDDIGVRVDAPSLQIVKE